MIAVVNRTVGISTPKNNLLTVLLLSSPYVSWAGLSSVPLELRKINKKLVKLYLYKCQIYQQLTPSVSQI